MKISSQEKVLLYLKNSKMYLFFELYAMCDTISMIDHMKIKTFERVSYSNAFLEEATFVHKKADLM